MENQIPEIKDNNSINQPVNNPVVQIEKPVKPNFIIILLSVFLIIAVLIAGFFAYQTQNLVKELNTVKIVSVPTAIATVVPTSTPDATIDWKTYTNKEYNFTIKYPSDAKLRVSQTESNDRMLVVAFDSPNAVFDHLFKSGGYSFQISMQTQKNFNTLDEYLLFQKEHSMYEDVLPKTYNNVKGYAFKNDKGYPGWNFTFRGFLTKNNDLYYTINYFTDDSVDTFDQILSTFKFTN